MAKKKKKNNKFSPIITMLFLIAFVIVGSSFLSILNIDSNTTRIINGSLETSIVVIRNIFSKEGFIYFFSTIMTNFSLIQPIFLLILSLLAVSIGKNSGLLKHLFTPFKKMNFQVLIFIVLFISVISTFIGDYSYVILLPFVAALYQYLGKNPMLGILTVFLGITLGYGTGIFYNYNDLSLGLLTQAAAVVDVDATYKYNLTSNLYIMIFSTFMITYLLTILIDKYLSKKITISEPYEDELKTSKKALMTSQLSLILIIAAIVALVLPSFGGILLDNNQSIYIAKLFSETSPFYQSFMFIFLVLVILTSLIYGYISKNFKNTHDSGFALTKEFGNIGYLFVLLFLYSILIGIINWTNIGVVLVNNLVSLLSVLQFTGTPLIIITFIFIIIMSLLMPGSIEKWSLISPILIPLFMRANISPNFTQFIFSAADSMGKAFTPTFIYFIIMLGFVQKYNVKENKIGLFGTIKLTLPIIITIMITWLLIIIIWYVSGLPLGIGTFATM